MQRRQFITRFTAGVVALGASDVAFGQERRYLTDDQALRLIFPNSQGIQASTVELNDQQAHFVEQAIRLRLSSRTQTVYRGESNGGVDGYAMILNEIGKDQYITFVVGVTPDFRVGRVAMMVFRESRGWEVEDPRFTNQFRGKSLRDRLLIGSDIIGVTGATLSSRAFCRGTKKALAICQALYQ